MLFALEMTLMSYYSYTTLKPWRLYGCVPNCIMSNGCFVEWAWVWGIYFCGEFEQRRVKHFKRAQHYRLLELKGRICHSLEWQIRPSSSWTMVYILRCARHRTCNHVNVRYDIQLSSQYKPALSRNNIRVCASTSNSGQHKSLIINAQSKYFSPQSASIHDVALFDR